MCALPAGTREVCADCLKHPPQFDSVLAAAVYEYPLDSMIQAFKYGGDITLARPLAAILAERIQCDRLPDVIMPMPLSLKKERDRGFNQAMEIARQLPEALRRLVRADLERVIHTPAQAGLPLEERRRNVSRAFRSRETVRGKRVAILDDVMTSGATLDAAAGALKAAGAVEVHGWIIARALRPGRYRAPVSQRPRAG